MAYLIAQGGSNLYKMDLTTGVATALTLPTGVTIDSTRKPRFAVLNNWVVVVNSPSRNLAIDPEGTVRVLVPRGPTFGPTLASSGTGLTGAYQMKVSFVVQNSDGELLMESPLSPASASFTAANQGLSITRIAQSTDDITARRLYRTAAGGTSYYQLMDVDGNTATSLINNTADASLSLLPTLSSTLTAPAGTVSGVRMKMITEWKSRLWGVADDITLLDTVFVSETNKVYAWPNSVVAYPTGQDAQGIVGFVARKNQLGILKRSGLWAIIGASGSTGIALGNMQVQQVTKDDVAGSGSPDTILVVNDAAYWLGNDGVYEWTDQGLKNISDEQVAPWFKTDTYFNRSQFPNAFARYNASRNQVEFHLAAAGSSNIDRWVSFNLKTRTWFGPHQTAALTPTHAAHLRDDNGLPVTLVGGSDGVVYVGNQATYRDGAASIIDFDCYGPFHHAGMPDVQKYWGETSVLSKVQSGGTLSLTPYLGVSVQSLVAQTAMSHDMTTGRELLSRIGDGAVMQMRVRQNTLNQGVALYGYEVNPVFANGRR